MILFYFLKRTNLDSKKFKEVMSAEYEHRPSKRGRWNCFLEESYCPEGGSMCTRMGEGTPAYFGNTQLDVTTKGAVRCVNAVLQGVGAWNRLGNTIRMKSLSFRLTPAIVQFDNKDPNYGGILVIYDRQTNKVTPEMNSFLYEYNNLGAKRTGADHPVAKEMADRFVCLWRHDFVFPATPDPTAPSVPVSPFPAAPPPKATPPPPPPP